jgi:hypothetical protein
MKITLSSNARQGARGQGTCLAMATADLSRLSDLPYICVSFEQPKTLSVIHPLGYSL